MNIAQSKRNVFDEDQSIVTGITKFIVLLGVYVFAIDYVVFTLTPGE